MPFAIHADAAPLRILCLEDNPLIVFHLEQLIEDLGYVFVVALESAAELYEQFSALEIDAALVDIDLADGRTGPQAAAWLAARGIPAIFVTGQEEVAAEHRDLVLGIVTKPIDQDDFTRTLELLRRPSAR